MLNRLGFVGNRKYRRSSLHLHQKSTSFPHPFTTLRAGIFNRHFDDFYNWR
jgi:hypothetical protein